MRNLILITLALLLTYSCSKDDNDIEPRGSATFKVNNVEKTFTKLNSFNNGVLALGDSKDELVSLFFPVPQKSVEFPVVYNMKTEDIITASYVFSSKTYNATNGLLGLGQIGKVEITVTAYNGTKISGTFTLTLINKDDDSDLVTISGKFTDRSDLNFCKISFIKFLKSYNKESQKVKTFPTLNGCIKPV